MAIDRRLLIFTRAPIPGRVKTRLCPPLNDKSAAAFHVELLSDTVRKLAGGRWQTELHCEPDTDHPLFTELASEYRLSLRGQHGDGLGERMFHAIAAGAAVGPVVLVGTDCPALTAQRVEQAFAALEAGSGCVFNPVEDGGYCLVGQSRPRPEPFADIAWGTAVVMEQTRERLAAAGMSWKELDPLWDVDRPADLQRYCDWCAETLPSASASP